MEKILVIDDDQSIRETLTTFLKRQGYQPMAAEDGSKGVELIRIEMPDLVICDYKIRK